VIFEYIIADVGELPDNVLIKDTNDIETGEYVYLPRTSAETLIQTDSKSRFYSEQNDIDPITDIENMKPFFNIRTKFDTLFGAEGARTQIKHHMNSRRFLCVTSGKIQVKMTPYKSRHHLHPFRKNDEFCAKVDVWKPQEKYANEYEKIKFLEFDVSEGHVLYVPPYWFYSIRFSNAETRVSEITCNALMNVVAFLPTTAMTLVSSSA
jgi:hypothetical protein